MNIIDQKIINLTNKYNNFLIAFSGGIDSTVLLYSLWKIKKKKNINIRAIHINHNLNKLSKKWENHCINICKKLKIKLIIKLIKINKKYNIENQCREKRYFFFLKNIVNKEILLTAHHKNDQCETILLSLKRGSGLNGLIGINKKKKINKKIIYRPLLNIYKKDIKKYAFKNKLIWINDISNNNINIDRNFLRILIIPKILKRWPFFINSILRTSKICNNINIFLNKIIKKKFFNILNKKNILFFKKILKLNKQEFFLIIRKWIKLNNKKMLSYKNINILLKIIKNSKKKYFQIIFKEFNIYKYKKLLFLIDKKKKIKNIIWKYKYKDIILPNNIGILTIKKNTKYNKKNIVRKPLKNEIIYIKFNNTGYINISKNKKQKIKKIWQKYKIYPWERNYIPIIYYNNIPIISPNLFKTEYSKTKNKDYWNINLIK